VAVSSVRTVADRYGTRWTFYNDAGTLKYYSDINTTPVSGFALPATDTAFDVTIDTTGRWTVVYQSSGTLLSKYSDTQGAAWV